MRTAVYSDTGEITCTYDHLEMVDIENLIGDANCIDAEGIDTVNCYVLDGKICKFTDEEIQVRDHLPTGFTWKMPERIAIDYRDEAARKRDAQIQFVKDRVALYPSRGQFEDAMYWASRGKPELLEKYYADVDHVKATVPKVE
jgi:hypothetical protein